MVRTGHPATLHMPGRHAMISQVHKLGICNPALPQAGHWLGGAKGEQVKRLPGAAVVQRLSVMIVADVDNSVW